MSRQLALGDEYEELTCDIVRFRHVGLDEDWFLGAEKWEER